MLKELKRKTESKDHLTIDERAAMMNEQYPNGNIIFNIAKSDDEIEDSTGGETGKKRKTYPLISWAFRCVNNRTGKRACLGIYSCPHPGCTFRENPRVPTNRGNKYSTKGKVPPPNTSNGGTCSRRL